jgi:membrane protease YdiL (CAAX protease family)
MRRADQHGTVSALWGVVAWVAGSMAFGLVTLVLLATGQVKTEGTGVSSAFTASLRFSLLLGAMSAVEEVIFRALGVGLGMRVAGVWPAIAGSSLLFAAAHRTGGRLSGWAWLNLLLVGLLLGAIYATAGLPAAIGFHWGWNQWEWWWGFRVSGEATSRYLPVRPRTRLIPGFPYGPEGHPAATAVLLLALAAMLWATHAAYPAGAGHAVWLRDA